MDTASTLRPIYNEIPQVLFSWFDYALFSIMLGLSAVIGVYFGCFASKQNTADEYLLGGKAMKVFPIACSLIASHTSGMALLSVPVDVYKYGSTYWWICITVILSCVTSCYVFAPVFMKLELTSTYEYLELRFDRKIRKLASFMFALSILLYNPVVIYIPALAFAQATGVNLHFVAPLVCLICIFYTTIGGLKAVVWTDTLQTISIVACLIVVVFMGIASVGGISTIWQKSVEGHRLDLMDFDLDPTKRDSFWALVVGGSAYWMSDFCVNQGTIQRFLAVPSMKHVKKVILIFCIGIVLVKTTNIFIGLTMYVKYLDCDPISANQVLHDDQMIPYFVMDVAGNIPGLPGLFIAGVFSAALSSLSTTLNTLACTIYADFIEPFMPENSSEKFISNILKLIVVVTGFICTALVFVVEHLGGILPLVVCITGITGGASFGLFCLGMLFPMANSKGALSGGIIGLIFSSWLVFGHQWYKHKGTLQYYSKPFSIDGCNFTTNITMTESSIPMDDEPFVLYRISFWYFTLIGTIVTIVVGLVVSWFTSNNDAPVNSELISPVIRFFLSKEKRELPPAYYSVDKALHLVSLNIEKEKEKNSSE